MFILNIHFDLLFNLTNIMTSTLYVGGIPYATSEDALKEAFSKAGKVQSVTIIIDKMTGKSKGFGFIEMESGEAAQSAIEMFDGKELDGRVLRVNEARPRGMQATPQMAHH